MIREITKFFQSGSDKNQNNLVDKILENMVQAHKDGYEKGYGEGYLKGMKHKNALLGEK